MRAPAASTMMHTLSFGRSHQAWAPCARQNKTASRRCAAQASRVLLTREEGKNAAVIKMLEQRDISFYELPMIETTEGPDNSKLEYVLKTQDFDWIVITSPEAASVFSDSWHAAGSPTAQVAVVGKGTSKALALCAPSIQPGFVPSIANAETLSAELPLPASKQHWQVLYPASAKAKNTLQGGLESRGCEVLRLNTYSTEKVQQVSEQQLEEALACDVVAVASPSALKAWVSIAGETRAKETTLACIGSTSGNAALALGYDPERVLWSDTPGLQGLVDCIEQALSGEVRSAVKQ